MNLEYVYGQTPLDDDEMEGLLIPSIATRAELDEFEQQNIEEAMQWLLGKTLKASEILTEKFVCGLHRRMYGNVWSWAGKFRKTDKNLGIDKWQIPSALKSLCDDTIHWLMNDTYTSDEVAIRFKHRIVSIHCFSNGNGRHSRLMADVIIEKVCNKVVFSWGSSLAPNEVRTEYLRAVKAADHGNIEQLISFARL